MRAQHQAFGLLRAEFRHNAVPQQAGGTQFGGLHEEVHADGEEERQAGGEIVDIHAARKGRADIFAPIGEGKAQFLHQIRTGFLHVVAGNRDRIELGHFAGCVVDDIRHDPHRGFRRVDIGVAHHKFFENVVLDCAR